MSQVETGEEGLLDTQLFASKVAGAQFTEISPFQTIGIVHAKHSVRKRKELVHWAVEFISIVPHEVLRNDGMKYVNYEDAAEGHYVGTMTTQEVWKAGLWKHRILVGRNPNRIKPM